MDLICWLMFSSSLIIILRGMVSTKDPITLNESFVLRFETGIPIQMSLSPVYLLNSMPKIGRSVLNNEVSHSLVIFLRLFDDSLEI